MKIDGCWIRYSGVLLVVDSYLSFMYCLCLSYVFVLVFLLFGFNWYFFPFGRFYYIFDFYVCMYVYNNFWLRINSILNNLFDVNAKIWIDILFDLQMKLTTNQN